MLKSESKGAFGFFRSYLGLPSTKLLICSESWPASSSKVIGRSNKGMFSVAPFPWMSTTFILELGMIWTGMAIGLRLMIS